MIERSAKLLEGSNLLPYQWHSEHELDRVFYGELPAPAASFAKVFDGGRLLILSDSEYQEMRVQFPKLPALSVFRQVKEMSGLHQPATLPRPLPQIYNINPNNPSINLVTDLGVNPTREETLLFFQASLDGRLFAETEKAKSMGVTLQGYGTWMNPTAIPVAIVLQAMLHAASDQRHMMGLKPLRNLEILYLSGEIADPKNGLSHREGYFDPASSRIYVHLSDDPHLPHTPSHTAVSQMVGTVLPAPLEHEFYHYLFYRPEVAGSAFILEGEATANGERLHQGLIAGSNVKSDAPLKLRELVQKIEAGNDLTEDEERDYGKLQQEFLARQPLTQTQCDSFDTVYQHHVVAGEPFRLEQLIARTPGDFNRNNPVLGYAEAWAVYHAALIEGKDWDKTIQQSYAKMSKKDSLNQSELTMLNQISAQTIEWVRSNRDTISRSCAH